MSPTKHAVRQVGADSAGMHRRRRLAFLSGRSACITQSSGHGKLHSAQTEWEWRHKQSGTGSRRSQTEPGATALFNTHCLCPQHASWLQVLPSEIDLPQ